MPRRRRKSPPGRARRPQTWRQHAARLPPRRHHLTEPSAGHEPPLLRLLLHGRFERRSDIALGRDGDHARSTATPWAWEKGKDGSVAKLASGEKGEVILNRNQGMTDDPIVIQNLRYWGATKNHGFLLMQNEVVSYSATSKPFEYRGTNGFMITVEVDSESAAGKGY